MKNYLGLLFVKIVPFLREIYTLSTITFVQEITPSHIVVQVKQYLMQAFGEENPLAEIVGSHDFHNLQMRGKHVSGYGDSETFGLSIQSIHFVEIERCYSSIVDMYTSRPDAVCCCQICDSPEVCYTRTVLIMLHT